MTLTEFLHARIAEDEDVARRNWDGLPVEAWPLTDADGYADVSIAAPRVLAECKAKRKVIARLDLVMRSVSVDIQFHLDVALRALALPYADHPDFRPEWRLP